jgi:hypothetical protein
MRIRTEGQYEHREDAIEDAAQFYDCNKTLAVVSACEDVPKLVSNIEDVLRRDDLTAYQKQSIADTLSTIKLQFEVSEEIETQRP